MKRINDKDEDDDNEQEPEKNKRFKKLKIQIMRKKINELIRWGNIIIHTHTQTNIHDPATCLRTKLNDIKKIILWILRQWNYGGGGGGREQVIKRFKLN